jgi:hypothetical protein
LKVADEGVGIGEVKVVLNGKEYKDLRYTGDIEVNINEDIMKDNLIEGENVVEIIVKDQVGNGIMKEIRIYKDTIEPKIKEFEVK